MRRTAPFLLAAALLVAAGPVAVADPAAEVGPGSVEPGGSVTVSVSCDPLGGTAPDTLDAVSQAFAEGTVKLAKVPGTAGTAAGPAYRGSAVVAAGLGADDGGLGPDTAWTVDGTCPAPPGGQGSPWSATFDVDRPATAGGDGGAGGGAGLDAGVAADPAADPATDPAADLATDQGAGLGAGVGAGVGGGGVPPCPHDKPCPTARPTEHPVEHPTGRPPEHPVERPTGPASVGHGVRAGAGGAFRDSVPALVAGGLLIAGACGAAAHRLLRRRRTPSGI
ncbi:hypothetical protein U5640_06155 [Streptomyces sp. SS7]|uniref:hypothetical protein n=1 Tax=Streptomyces sp. SS7 TaxID=3108485 RepID=UPI0030EC7ABB